MDAKPVPDGVFDEFVVHSLDEETLPAQLGTYDFILVLDRLEHLMSPETVLAELRQRCYAEQTKVILTAPNIGFLTMRLGLLFGQFNYSRQGILDLTHKRLFTFRSFRKMVEQEGFVVTRMKGVPAPFPKAFGSGWFGRFLLNANRAFIVVYRRLFAYQIYMEAKFLPPLDRLLARTVEASRQRSAEGGLT